MHDEVTVLKYKIVPEEFLFFYNETPNLIVPLILKDILLIKEKKVRLDSLTLMTYKRHSKFIVTNLSGEPRKFV